MHSCLQCCVADRSDDRQCAQRLSPLGMHEFGPLESSEECAQMLLAPGAPIAQTPRRSTDVSPIRNSATMIVWDVPSIISGMLHGDVGAHHAADPVFSPLA